MVSGYNLGGWRATATLLHQKGRLRRQLQQRSRFSMKMYNALVLMKRGKCFLTLTVNVSAGSFDVEF